MLPPRVRADDRAKSRYGRRVLVLPLPARAFHPTVRKIAVATPYVGVLRFERTSVLHCCRWRARCLFSRESAVWPCAALFGCSLFCGLLAVASQAELRLLRRAFD